MPDKQAILIWRANGGYQNAPEPPPHPTPIPPPPMMYCLPGRAPSPWICQPYQYPGYQPYPPYAGGIEGPIPVAGVCTPPPPYGNISPPPPPLAPPPAADKRGSQKGSDKNGDGKKAAKDDEKKGNSGKAEAKPEGKKENPAAPPKLQNHANYMYDTDHTMVHIFSKAVPVWTEKYQKEQLKFKMFRVSINFTVKMIIENILKKKGDDCKGWAATEVIERGGGGWEKGSTIEYDSDKSNGTMKSMGWSPKRGDALPPVWLVLHKVDFK